MEFPVTIKNQSIYFRSRFDDAIAGNAQLIVDPEALFLKRGFVVPVSYRSMCLIDSIEAGEPVNPYPGCGCIVINSQGQVHKVVCTRNDKYTNENGELPYEFLHLRIPVGPHTSLVYAVDQAMLAPQLLAAMESGRTPEQAYEALCELQNITRPYLVKFTIEAIAERLKKMGYTQSVGDIRKTPTKFSDKLETAIARVNGVGEKVTST